MRFVIRDPKKGSPGSPFLLPENFRQTKRPCALYFRNDGDWREYLTQSDGAVRVVEMAALLISPPWYTSEKSLYARNSDLTGTAIR